MCKAVNLLPVGSIFAFRKVRLQVVEGRYCHDCYFLGHKDVNCFAVSIHVVPPCSGFARSDGKNVVFKKVADID